MTSVRQAALSVLWARVTTIRTSNGFNTEAGARVYIGERPVLGPDDPEASIAIVVRADEPSYNGENVVIKLPVEVQAIVRADAADPWSTIEEIVTDIKRAVETDHDLGKTLVHRGLERGATQPLDRESGSEFVAASVEYRLTFKEGWGQP